MDTTDWSSIGAIINFTSAAPEKNPNSYNANLVWVGVVLAILGNFLNSLSFNTQKFAHMRIEAQKEKPECPPEVARQQTQARSPAHYLKSPVWWLGIILMGVGEVVNFVALGFAPASIAVPLGVVTILGNMVMARLWLREKPRADDLAGTLLAVGGSFLLIWFANKKDYVLNGDELLHNMGKPLFIIYICILITMLIITLVARFKFHNFHILVLMLITNGLASFTVMSAKAVAGMIRLTVDGNMQLQHPIFWVLLILMVATAISQVKFLQEALAKHDSTVVLPISYAFFTIGAILMGIILYNEFYGMLWWKVILFLLGCGLAFVGVFLIASKSEDNPHNGYLDNCIKRLRDRRDSTVKGNNICSTKL